MNIHAIGAIAVRRFKRQGGALDGSDGVPGDRDAVCVQACGGGTCGLAVPFDRPSVPVASALADRYRNRGPGLLTLNELLFQPLVSIVAMS